MPQCSSTSTKYNWDQVNELSRALRSLERLGLDQSPAFKELNALRGKIIKQIGFKFPRVPSVLAVIAGLSPGSIKVWHDAESGFYSEARVDAHAPPVYRKISDEVAATILKGELTHELEDVLMKPDEYLGE